MTNFDKAKQAAGEATILFFEMGDFYELHDNDARIAARILGLTLLKRGKDDPTPMAGFPRHQIDKYLVKMVAAGHRCCVINA